MCARSCVIICLDLVCVRVVRPVSVRVCVNLSTSRLYLGTAASASTHLASRRTYPAQYCCTLRLKAQLSRAHQGLTTLHTKKLCANLHLAEHTCSAQHSLHAQQKTDYKWSIRPRLLASIVSLSSHSSLSLSVSLLRARNNIVRIPLRCGLRPAQNRPAILLLLLCVWLSDVCVCARVGMWEGRLSASRSHRV